MKELILEAKKASEKAYAPYSHFFVGAAVLTDTNKIFTGCNVENASFGLSLCAERVAVMSAVANGELGLKCIAVYAQGRNFPFPCGACLQVLAEFNPKLSVILMNGNNKIKKTNVKKLLTEPFSLRK